MKDFAKFRSLTRSFFPGYVSLRLFSSRRLSAPVLKRKSQSTAAEISAIPSDEPITFWKANETLWVFCLFTVNYAVFFLPSLLLPMSSSLYISSVSASFYPLRFCSFDTPPERPRLLLVPASSYFYRNTLDDRVGIRNLQRFSKYFITTFDGVQNSISSDFRAPLTCLI